MNYAFFEGNIYIFQNQTISDVDLKVDDFIHIK